MWHEARRQERKIRGMLVDYRRRAERRRDFYEKIKADPTQFLQLHGRKCKIHLDPAVAAAADSSAAMMPWQNQSDNLIDRFDVRAHLDYIPPVPKEEEEELTYDERQLNYERYRIIAQNSFLNISEEKFLKQLHMEEQFGYTEEPKKKKNTGAAIGFNYEEGTGYQQPQQPQQDGNEAASDENSDSDLDVDLSINISKIDQFQAHDLNRHGRNFGMSSNDFYSFLTNDLEEAESYRLAKEEEHEKALFSGRKSRRERRAHREKRLANRKISPPSYAARTSPTYPSFRDSKSASKSPTPENTGKITYITSFGDEEEPTTSKPTYADKVKHGKPRSYRKRSSSVERTGFSNNTGVKERERYRKRYRSRSRSQSRGRDSKYKSRKARSSSSDRSKSRRSRSYSKDRHKRSKSRSRERSRSYKSRRRSSTTSTTSSSPSPRRTRRRKRSTSSSLSSSSSSSSSSTTNVSNEPSRRSSRSKSKSPVVKKEVTIPKAPLPRYYGRKRSDQSSSDLEDGSGEESGNNAPAQTLAPAQKQTSYGNAGSATNSQKSSVSLSLQERLKRKRQALLNKQFKADKIAEQLKTEREKQEQQNREDELREMAIKLRRRQREIRHAYDSNSPGSSDSEEKKPSPSSISSHKRSPSRSPSPKPKPQPIERKDSPSRYIIKRSPKLRPDVVERRGGVGHKEEPERGYRKKDEGRREPTGKDRNMKSLVDY